MKIEKYVHRCVAKNGNDYEIEVDFFDYESANRCVHCDELFFDKREILVHIYEQLTEEE